jgi:hypothetical protein
MKKSSAKSYALRIDAQLVKPLQELKKQHRRSLNAEINAALENWVVRSRSADTVREDPSPIPPTPAAVNRSKEKPKPTRKQPAVRVKIPAVTPGDG